MVRLNGWQRIWLVLAGVLLGLHLAVGYLMLPDYSSTRFDPLKYQRSLVDIEKRQLDNTQRCRVAADDVQLAIQANADYQAKGEAASKALQAVTQGKLDAAKARLFAIETSGGKFYEEWSKVNNAIEAYETKLREQAWKPRPFNALEMAKTESLITLRECDAMDKQRIAILADIDTAKQSAESARENVKAVVFGTLISFLCFAFGLYFFGWCIGWIRSGFVAKL